MYFPYTNNKVEDIEHSASSLMLTVRKFAGPEEWVNQYEEGNDDIRLIPLSLLYVDPLVAIFCISDLPCLCWCNSLPLESFQSEAKDPYSPSLREVHMQWQYFQPVILICLQFGLYLTTRGVSSQDQHSTQTKGVHLFV